MDKTTKIIRGIAVGNFIIFGLAACSSTPAPWTQANDSPWGAKHAAEEETVMSDPAVADTSLNDPVLLADPEPEPIMMQEPEMAITPEVIVPVVVEEEVMTTEQEIMAMPGTHYAVQVYAGKTSDSVEKFKSSKALDELKMVKTDRAGSVVYVLVDIHPDRATANAAAADLEIKTGSKPWVRSVAGLQNIVAQ